MEVDDNQFRARTRAVTIGFARNSGIKGGERMGTGTSLGRICWQCTATCSEPVPILSRTLRTNERHALGHHGFASADSAGALGRLGFQPDAIDLNAKQSSEPLADRQFIRR